MNPQNQIKRPLSKSSNIEYVRSLLERNDILNRSHLAEAVCDQLGFHDARGEKQLSGCLKALRTLETAGHFVFPESRQTTASGPGSPRRLPEPVPLSVDVSPRVDDVSGLDLILVTNPDHMRIWNERMIGEHPQGAGPLVGRQLRYLIASEHGWLGGFGFGPAALQLADRDKWIGWNGEQRQAHLHSVLSMSRFLIHPSVQCGNLASKVLGMSMAALPTDFEQQYGYLQYLVEGGKRVWRRSLRRCTAEQEDCEYGRGKSSGAKSHL